MAELLIKIGDNRNFKDGDIISAYSDEDIARVWFEMLARGTHGRPEIPFIPEFYKKYFERIIQYRLPGNKSKIVMKEATCNFREASNPKRNIFAFDRPKQDIYVVNNKMMLDMLKYFMHSDMTDITGTKKLIECWQWGIDELKLFLVIPIPDKEFKSRDNIKGLTAPIMKKDEMISRRKYRIEFRNDSAIHKALNLDRTISETIDSGIPEKLKAKYLNRLKASRIYPFQKMIDWVDDPELPNYPDFNLNLKSDIITEKKL